MPEESKTPDDQMSFVALVPDSTHNAPPISEQEEDYDLTLKEISARERSKLIKRAQRQNTDFRWVDVITAKISSCIML